MGNYIRSSYQAVSRPWRSNFRRRGTFVGVELEIESNQGFGRILDLLPDIKNLKHRPITETDGSLDYHRGVEIIFPPVKPSTLLSKGSVFGKAITALQEVGAQRNNVGMHLNVNTNNWSPLRIAAFLTVVHHLPRQALESLGGRRLNDYCDRPYGGDRDINITPSLVNSNCRNQHRFCAETKTNRIELRFPGSTTDRKRLRQLMNFITLLSDFSALAAEELAATPVAYVKAFGIYLSGSKKGQSLRKYMGVSRVSPNLNSPSTSPF